MSYCSFEVGMFGSEKATKLTGIDAHYELLAACFHECGHAVAGFLLGQGCESIEVRTEKQMSAENAVVGIRFSGMAQEAPEWMERVNADLMVGLYTKNISVHGIATAAGPASERKFRLLQEMPCGLNDATVGDFADLQTIARSLAQSRRSSQAYFRLVWRAAQRMVEDAAIWNTIDELAYELSYSEIHTDCRVTTSFMSGEHACGVMLDNGLSPWTGDDWHRQRSPHV